MAELRQAAAGWYWLEVTETVRTLDALHLASALELLDPFPELQVLSFDERILQNLHPLGLGLPAAQSGCQAWAVRG